MQHAGKHIKKLLFTFVCFMAILLAACGSNGGISDLTRNPPTPTVVGTPSAPYDKQIFRSPLSVEDIDSFDPALSGDLYSEQAITLVFNGLVSFDDKLQVQPELAASWDQSSDGLQWRFHLRSNLMFSDGTPLTSADVAYSIDRALQPALKSTRSLTFLGLIQDADKLNAGKIKTIIGDSILIPDANTVVLRTTQKAAYFLYDLTYPTSYVVEKRLIDKYGNDKFTDHLAEGGGSGPFIVSQYIHKKEIDFVPNPYYYGLKPRLQEVIFPFIGNDSIAYQAYQNGEVDTTHVPSALLDQAKATSEYIQVPLLTTRYVAMNFLAKPFDDLRIRQAFALSIQRETLVHQIFKDTVTPTYHIIPQEVIGYHLDLTGPFGIKDTRGNVSVAQQLFRQGLQEEGWSDISQMPPITLTYGSGDPVRDKIVTLLSQMWQKALGVNVIPNPIDFNMLIKNLEATRTNPKGLQMWMLSWSADYSDPHDWTTLQFDKGAAGNYMNYGQNNTKDALQEKFVQQQLEQADAESNPTTRIQLYDNAEQQLINAVAWIPLYQWTQPTLVKPYVQGFVFNELQLTPPTDWANVYIAQH